ncbi:hypothetical protein ABTJ45_20365, partial [Acinetobacter baumannii]
RPDRVAAWGAQRLGQAEARLLSARIGHRAVLALPPPGRHGTTAPSPSGRHGTPAPSPEGRMR